MFQFPGQFPSRFPKNFPSAFTEGEATPPEEAPVNSVAPAVTGNPWAGQTLSCSTGTWSGSPTSYAYQWKKNGTNISGATSSTWLVASVADADSITCAVTATNTVGASDPATSNALSALVIPINTVAPVTSGNPYPGETISVTTGTFTGSASTKTYQWQKNGTNVSGQTASTMAVDAASPAHGDTLRCVVTATNAAGSDNEPSNALTVVVTPANLTLPSITGDDTEGATLTAVDGTFSNGATVTRQWWKNGSNTGSTGATYSDTTPGDEVFLRNIGTNAAGSASADSDPVEVVEAGDTPVNTATAFIEGNWEQRGTLRIVPDQDATWDNADTTRRSWFEGAVDTEVTGTEHTLDAAAEIGDIAFLRSYAENEAGEVDSDSDPSDREIIADPMPDMVWPVLRLQTHENLEATLGITVGGEGEVSVWKDMLSGDFHECVPLELGYSPSLAQPAGVADSRIRFPGAATFGLVLASSPMPVGDAPRSVLYAFVHSAAPTVQVHFTHGDDAANSCFGVYTNNLTLYCWFGDGTELTVANDLVDGQTYIYSAIYDGETLRCYIDGVLKATLSELVLTTVAGPLIIGNHVSNLYPSAADVIGFYIFDYALDSAEHEKAFNTINKIPSTLIAWPPQAPVNLVAPEITGNPWDGETLTTDDGEWDQEDLTFTYQWYFTDASGEIILPIDGATANTFEIPEGVYGEENGFLCIVSGFNGDVAGEGITEFVLWFDPPIPYPAAESFTTIQEDEVISEAGYTTTGRTLSILSPTTWENTPDTITYQWYHLVGAEKVPIVGATDATYEVDIEFASGDQIGVTEIGTNAYGSGEGSCVDLYLWNLSSVVSPPVITGVPQAEGVLTTSDAGSFTDTESVFALAHQWYVDTGGGGVVIEGETNDSLGFYSPLEPIQGALYYYTATPTNRVGVGAPVESNTIQAPYAPEQDLEAPGTEIADLLTDPMVVAGFTSADHLIEIVTSPTWLEEPDSLSYQWYADGLIVEGSTANTYGVTIEPHGTEITLVISAQNVAGITAALASNTVVVLGPPATTFDPVITGDFDGLTDGTLTCDPGTWDQTIVTYEYQWFLDDSPIGGATSDTHVVAASGMHYCRVTAYNQGGNSAMVNSNAAFAVPLP